PGGMAVDLLAPRPGRLAPGQLQPGMLDALAVHIRHLLVDAAERPAGDALLRVAESRAEGRADAKGVHLRALLQQPDDLELVEVATGENAHAAHTRRHQLLAHILA